MTDHETRLEIVKALIATRPEKLCGGDKAYAHRLTSVATVLVKYIKDGKP